MPIFGMKGTGDFQTNEDPEGWRQGIMKLFPNSSATLVAITSMMGKGGSETHKVVNWWSKTLQGQAGDITGVYTDSSLATAYSTGGAAGDFLYIKLSEAHAGHFRKDHLALLRDNSDLSVDVVSIVDTVVRNGASSYLKVKLVEADDNSGSNNLSNADRVLVTGSVASEGTGAPISLKYQPTQYSNNMHIFKTSVDETGTAMATELRTGDPFEEDQREGLLYHGLEMEAAFLFSQISSGTGDNGKRKYTMRGIIPWMKLYASTGIKDFRTDQAGQTWRDKGEDWLDDALETYSEWVGDGGEVLCLAGAGAINGLNKLAKWNGNIQLNPKDVSYGMRLQQWTNPFDIPLYLKSYWQFTKESNSYKNSLLILKPANIEYIPLEGRDTNLLMNQQANDADERLDQWLTECTLKIVHPEQFLLLHGVGLDG